MAIATITVGMSGSDVRSNINAAIAKANLVDSKADTTALTAEATARAAADTTLTNALAAEVTARTALDGEVEDLYTLGGEENRPGDAPLAFTSTLNPADVRDLADVTVSGSQDGDVVKTTGAARAATRRWCRLEPGRYYRVRYAVRRAVNSPDPSDDAVRMAIAWYDADKVLLAAPDTVSIVKDRVNLTTGNGRVQNTAVVCLAAGASVTVQAPAGAVYAKPYVETFGATGETYIEVIEWKDITDNKLWAPAVADVDARVTALESLDIGDRLEFLEGLVPPILALEYKSTSFQAVSGGRYICNTTAGAFNATLPTLASGAMGEVELFDINTSWGTNSLTVLRNGSTIQGLAENLVANVANGYVRLIGRSGAWRIVP